MPRLLFAARSRSTAYLLRAARPLALAAVAWLCAASPALADSTSSGNWAGYSAHRAGVKFRSVSARWRVPAGSCVSSGLGYSSIWVGLGGFSKTSGALEQTGTELDCTRDGQTAYSAWYELVPAAPRQVSLGVQPGDEMQGGVTVVGNRVTVLLADLTNRRTFHQTFYAPQVDTTSADWIVEAPSACDQANNCLTLPLADFGTASMASARAVSQSGHAGAITSRWWGTTTITLRPDGTRFFADTADGAAGQAIPSPLSAGGSVFSVSYRAVSATAGQTGPPGPIFAVRAGARHLVHPTR